MKKSLLFILLLLVFSGLYATTYTVTVANFQFSPSTLNVVVGDVIHWQWTNGSHTTTSLGIPAGAASWNRVMNSGNTTFDYTVTTAGTYNYQCNPHAPGMSASFTASGVVPVGLNYVKVSSAGKGKALFTWETSSEGNLSHFLIRKSNDGTIFKEIGKVPATGNSVIVHDYSFTDVSAGESKYLYYYLSSVDLDGKIQNHPIRLFKNESVKSTLSVRLSQNPVSAKVGHMMFTFNAEKEGQLHITVIDAQRRVFKTDDAFAVKGVNNGHVHLGDAPKGTYTAVFTLDGMTETKKVVVID